jgi:hypothetical protein
MLLSDELDGFEFLFIPSKSMMFCLTLFVSRARDYTSITVETLCKPAVAAFNFRELAKLISVAVASWWALKRSRLHRGDGLDGADGVHGEEG